MKMLFRQRIFSWLDSYDIYDERNNPLFVVKGVPAWKHCLKIVTPDGRELGMVRERMTFLRPRFDLTVNGADAGSIVKEITFLRPRFTLDFRHWSVEGDWFEWNYRIMRGPAAVAAITKRIWRLSDTYEIDVADPEDALGALMVTLAIDAVKCSQKRR